MAGNENSGRIPTFHLSEKDLEQAINNYKNDLEEGVFSRASWPHFAAYIDCTEQELAEVIKLADSPGTAYRGRGVLLKKMATWIRGQMMSAPGWNGQLTSRAIFALKQDVGDGVRWSDAEEKKTGPQEVVVRFGGNDERAKNAAK